MLKNAIIALLSTGLLFSNTILSEYGWLAYIATSMIVFFQVFAIECYFKSARDKIRLWKKFNNTVNRKITLNQPTKAS